MGSERGLRFLFATDVVDDPGQQNRRSGRRSVRQRYATTMREKAPSTDGALHDDTDLLDV
jgi:predicted urease superfamily metal-dependent hydrolase